MLGMVHKPNQQQGESRMTETSKLQSELDELKEIFADSLIEDIDQRREELRETINDLREEMNEEIKELKKESKSELKEQIKALKESWKL
jgi:predicted  nucleic acid-binding Zn-ribbon protein